MRGVSLVTIALVVMTGGCTFHSNQLASAKGLVKSSLFASANRVEQATWSAQYGLLVQDVELAFDEGEQVFSNYDGVRIVIKGKAVNSFEGFGLPRPINLPGESAKLRFGKGPGAHYCYDWAEERVDDGVLWTQTCDGGFSYQNSVSFDNEGRILSLSLVVDASGSRLKLIRKGPM